MQAFKLRQPCNRLTTLNMRNLSVHKTSHIHRWFKAINILQGLKRIFPPRVHVCHVVKQPDVIAKEKLQPIKLQETLEKVPAAAWITFAFSLPVIHWKQEFTVTSSASYSAMYTPCRTTLCQHCISRVCTETPPSHWSISIDCDNFSSVSDVNL